MDGVWLFQPCVFRGVCQYFSTPHIALFATRLYAQLSAYVSWEPGPSAMHINAFPWDWGGESLYAFPPFGMIPRALRKLLGDGGPALMILPLWPPQVWFPTALPMLAACPVLLPRCPLVLPHQPTVSHPRARVLVLTAMVLSGRRSHIVAFRQRWPSFSCSPGELVVGHYMGRVSGAGCRFVSAGKWILFNNLWVFFWTIFCPSFSE